MNKSSAINLIDFASIYQKELLPYQFIYDLSSGETVKLEFSESNFCHLLGIQYIDPNRADLRGTLGYNQICSGTITYDGLKSINRNALNSFCKDKMRFFDELPTLLKNPNVVIFDKSLTTVQTKVDCDFFLYNDDLSSTKNIMLGVGRDTNNHFPRTYLIESNQNNRFLKGQTPVDVINSQIK